MDYDEIKNKVIKVLNDFGMSGVKAAEAMGVTHQTFKNKKSDNIPNHSFNEKNYQDLVKYIKEHAVKL